MTSYFVDGNGAYIGGFDGLNPPEGSIEVPAAPESATQVWDGSQWGDPVLPPKEIRDNALASLVHDFGDGRVVQCRPHPFADESNMRNAIEQMNRLGQTERVWFGANDTPVTVTPADLQVAIESGQDQAALIWAQFFQDVS